MPGHQSTPIELAPPPFSDRTPGERWVLVVVLYLCFASIVAFFGLGSTDVVHMEGIVADGARYMVESGEIAVPRLHGDIYSYKPPLAYWMALSSFQFFGTESVWTLRFPFALSAILLGLGVLFLVGTVMGQEAALLCAAASISGALMLEKMHLAEFDLPLAAGVGFAVTAACRAFALQRADLKTWLLAYLGLTVAFLAKGIPALMFFAPGLLAAAFLTRNVRELVRWPHLAGGLLFSLLIGIWIASAYTAEGWLAFAQPLEEAQDKGLTWTWSAFFRTLTKPVELIALFLPWSLALPALLTRWRPSVDHVGQRFILAALGFTGAGLLTFMAVPSTEARYLLPLAAPMGILSGLLLAVGAVDERKIQQIIRVFGLLLGAGAVVFAFLLDETPWAARGGIIILGLASLALALRGASKTKSRSWSPLLFTTLAFLAVWVQTTAFEPHRRSSRSQQAMAMEFERHLTSEETLWTGPVNKEFHHSSLIYYLKRPVKTFHPESPKTWPSPGDSVLLFSDEHGPLVAALPFRCKVEARRMHRRTEFVLCRVSQEKNQGQIFEHL